MEKLKIVYRAPGDLVPYENSPRNIEPALPKLKADIQEFGFVSPVLLAGNEIVDGHARLMVALDMGMETIPTVDVSHLTPDQLRALRIVMNKSAEWPEWNEEKLLAELESIEMDMSAFGIDMDTLAASLDFSPLNKELSFDDAGTFTIRLNYSEDEYTLLKEAMEHLEAKPEQIFFEVVMSNVPIQMEPE